ncbi:hypothetical protein TrLO_g10634 [Triparma laevis f. longispina]|uniref:Uncharacterized protein n=1 Tax=Triparma laevis f. longispina TaxID=1714387 RepID=A0A9W7CHD9_9STRA|nr:hypothetical protein TrLO_g10634 [Triparma laevis f. longispina]
MALPENVKEVMKAASFFNIDLFNMVSVGCWTDGIGFFSKTMAMTLVVIMLCGALVSIGVVVKNHRSWCFTAITPLVFLWEPYKPSFWYWEIVETTRRLMMTGVLSTIQPGTFSQLVAGLLMNVIYFGLLCQTNPVQRQQR